MGRLNGQTYGVIALQMSRVQIPPLGLPVISQLVLSWKKLMQKQIFILVQVLVIFLRVCHFIHFLCLHKMINVSLAMTWNKISLRVFLYFILFKEAIIYIYIYIYKHWILLKTIYTLIFLAIFKIQYFIKQYLYKHLKTSLVFKCLVWTSCLKQPLFKKTIIYKIGFPQKNLVLRYSACDNKPN